MDKYKTILAIFLFILALIIPIIILLGGGSVTVLQMIQRSQGQAGNVDISRNLLLTLGGALAVFIIFVALAIAVLYTVKDLTWLGASLPFLFSTVYTTSLVDIIPDMAPLIGNVDDGTVVTFGAIFSMLLTLHRNPHVPKWVFVPLIVAAIYTFFGGVFPGGFDEIIVQAISYLVFAYSAAKRLPPPKEEEADVSIS
jgi:hypothetical protein